MTDDAFIPLAFEKLSGDEQRHRIKEFLERIRTRRTVRSFSSQPVPFEIIETAVRIAGLAPSGANQQPWRYIVVSDPAIKHKIRFAAEEEERENYEHRFPNAWKEVLAPLGTDWHKPFLDVAPYLIAVFAILYEEDDSAEGSLLKKKHYYVMESVGISVGFLLAALHLAGLATLTHTPNPMGFLNEILERPKNERPFVLIPVGYPADDAVVPNITKKSLDEIMTVFR